MEKLLFIGGKCDGQRLEVPEGALEVVQDHSNQFPPPRFSLADPSATPDAIAYLFQEVYHRVTLRDSFHVFPIMLYAACTRDEAVARLLAGYHPKASA